MEEIKNERLEVNFSMKMTKKHRALLDRLAKLAKRRDVSDYLRVLIEEEAERKIKS